MIEFLILTGARMGEARLLRRGDIRDGKVWLPTEKRRCNPRDAMRSLAIDSLGPRFRGLLARLRPHPESGLYFYASESKKTALTDTYANRLFKRPLAAIERTNFTLHDCRGTFAMHRAMVVDSFRQLQAELGHGDPKSIQSYLDRARQFDRRESIFYVPPRNRTPLTPMSLLEAMKGDGNLPDETSGPPLGAGAPL